MAPNAPCVRVVVALPGDYAAIELHYLGVDMLERKWTRAIPNWPTILGQLTVIFPNRFPDLKPLTCPALATPIAPFP